MIKIMTAMGNPKIIELLKKEKNIEIINKDILYREAILDILEKEKNINIILINELIEGEINLIELILKIKEINNNIEIIIFLEKENKLLENNLKINNINKIYYNNKFKINNIIKIIKNEKVTEEKNYKDNKKINFKPKELINNISLNMQKIKRKIHAKSVHNKEKNKKIITFIGGAKTGKSLMSLILANYLMKNNYKILLIDADILKKDISTILGIKIKNKKQKKIKMLKNNSKKNYKIKKSNKEKIFEKYFNKKIIKINNKLFLFSKIELLIYFFNNKKILFIYFINYIKKYFDFIIIDVGFYNNEKINKKIIENSDFNIILLEPNLLGIKETKILLEKINKLKNNKYNILINKENKYSINKEILKNCFYDINFLGKIKLNNIYNNLINNNFKNRNIFENKKIKNEIKKINLKIIKNN